MTITGRFVDENGDTSASVGESTEYNVTITNDGKVCRTWHQSSSSRSLKIAHFFLSTAINTLEAIVAMLLNWWGFAR